MTSKAAGSQCVRHANDKAKCLTAEVRQTFKGRCEKQTARNCTPSITPLRHSRDGGNPGMPRQNPETCCEACWARLSGLGTALLDSRAASSGLRGNDKRGDVFPCVAWWSQHKIPAPIFSETTPDFATIARFFDPRSLRSVLIRNRWRFSKSIRKPIRRFGDCASVGAFTPSIAAGEFFTLLGPSGFPYKRSFFLRSEPRWTTR